MTGDWRAHAVEHAIGQLPREACGLLVRVAGEERYWPCRNLAANERDFELAPEDYAGAQDLGEVIGVVHSHPDGGAEPSPSDLASCEVSGLPWHILGMRKWVWRTITPTGKPVPLIGRQFSYGVLDCLTLVRDWYRVELGIEFSDFERGVFGWWDRGEDRYLENFRAAGFEPVALEDIQRGDVILMQIRAKTVNHAAVYLGHDQMLHHCVGRLSAREVFGGYWAKNTRLVVRYRGPL